MAYNDPADSAERTTRYKLRITDKVGEAIRVLQIFESQQKNLTRVESMPCLQEPHSYYFFIDLENDDDRLDECLRSASFLTVEDKWSFPFFPKTSADLDLFANKVLDFSEDLSTDHPGFHDAEYRKRRTDIVQLAKSYRWGSPVPRVEYTETENQTWNTVFTSLKRFLPSHACSEHLRCFAELEEAGVYSPDFVPQLEDISRFLQPRTGFTLRPVQGLLSPRDFLNGLAFKVFHATQYIRHHSKPMYTPEPDVCHELLGHVPLFADPQFAQFSQEIGLASLGASDDDITRLATCYWFSVEFGLCKEGSEVRAYGAGLLSSFGELEYCLTATPRLLPFDPPVTCMQTYITTAMQPIYFVADSFSRATEQMRAFAKSLDRPFEIEFVDGTVQARIRPSYKPSPAHLGLPMIGMQGTPPPAWC